jgi:hypothetical protein
MNFCAIQMLYTQKAWNINVLTKEKLADIGTWLDTSPGK